MLISKFIVPESETVGLGLKHISMKRLGKYVAIAGKNGAGKSRLLGLLESSVHPYNQLAGTQGEANARLAELTAFVENNPAHPHIASFKREVEVLRLKIFRGSRILTDDGKQLKVLRFVPKKLDLADPFHQSNGQIESSHNNAAAAGIDQFSESALGYIQHVQNLWWNTSHPNFEGNQTEIKAAEEGYSSLCELGQTLLGARFTRLANGAAAIFDKPIASAGLSDGQKVILQLIAAIHAKRASLNNTVFILDELENHLHPSVTIEILERLSIAAPYAQIWIGTHSIPLLAYIVSIDPMALWYMEDGAVSHAGRHPAKVLESLLGDSERIGQLSAFTGLPAQLAAVNYAAESLLPPATLSGGDGDPQVSQIANVLSQKFSGQSPTILDFGAGKARLLEGIAANQHGSRSGLLIDYLAIDDSPKDRAQCISVIADYFPDAEARHFSRAIDFFERRDDKSVDVIVMCNVLHEIPPNYWHSIFSSETSIFQRALKEDGYLLLVEDQRIPVGEKAHEYGFLVFDTAQLKTLFSITQSDLTARLFISDDHRKDGRLKAHLVSVKLLSRLTVETIKKAVKELQSECLEQINEIRTSPPSYTNGQLHGFWTQQFANAHMYLSHG